MPNESLDRLQSEVSQTTNVQDSAAKLLRGIGAELKKVKDELANIGVDNATLNTLSDNLDTSTNDLAAAVAENTPTVMNESVSGGDVDGGAGAGAGTGIGTTGNTGDGTNVGPGTAQP
jgi:hypothetical protein